MQVEVNLLKQVIAKLIIMKDEQTWVHQSNTRSNSCFSK